MKRCECGQYPDVCARYGHSKRGITMNWQSEEHSLMAGMLIGHLMKAGVKAYPSVDEHGDYMNEIVIELDPGVESMKVKISVMPPIE